MAWLVGGGIVLYYIVPCRPNVVNTAERTVTRNCITFATISFLFISVVCVLFYGLLFSPVPGWLQPGVSNHPIAAPVPLAAPFPLCQPVFRLVSAITPR